MKSNCKSTQTIAHQDEGEGLHGNNESWYSTKTNPADKFIREAQLFHHLGQKN